MECKKIMRLLSLGAGLTAVALPSGVFAGRLQSASQQSETQADNTKTNKQENGGATADQQKENPADREVARKIRQAIVADKSLSTYAHNVKIIVRDGQVTLKGPVRSEDEKSNIAAKAADIAGADKVQNELTIKS
jgi:osmotically-inducible protein OsmY